MATDRAMKKEKPDHRQVLLDLIASQYGPRNAMVMDKAFKNEDKQIEQAMLEGGQTSEGIAQTRGIDLNAVNATAAKKSGGMEVLGSLLGRGVQPEGNQQAGANPALLQQMVGGQQQAQPGQEQPQQTPAGTRSLPKGPGGMFYPGSDTEQPGGMYKLLTLLAGGGAYKPTNETDQSLLAQRLANTELMNMQIEDRKSGQGVDKVYRNPITGEEVDEETANKEMKEGTGVYQVNQRISTRSGVQEKPLNKVPDLTQEEKKYVNDSRVIRKSMGNLKEGFKTLRGKYGDATWQVLQAEKLPYAIAQDQDVQSIKSELTYLQAAIPFLRGGKQLTPTEAKRVDKMLNPFGKSDETYTKDLDRFEDEFMYGSDIMQYGVNAGLMRRIMNADKKKVGKESPKKSEQTQSKYTEGQTATNPKTGKTLTYRSGKWQ